MSVEVRTSDVHIPLEDGSHTSARMCVPKAWSTGASLILAHGAGNDMHNPFLSYVHERVATAGIPSLKFNFPYKEAGRKAPDPKSRLEATWRAVIAWVREHPTLSQGKLFVGGKSLGGRIASQVVAAGESVDGLLFLGYPLHPAGKPEKLRVAHFPSMRPPALFIQGTRDRLCDLVLLREALSNLDWPTRVHLVEGGDHSFNVPKRMDVAQGKVWEDIAAAAIAFVAGRE